jgi:predicted RNA-binding Zn ribbon-like protein
MAGPADPSGSTNSSPYAETFRCPGGDLCLDFCNTGQGARGSRKTEWLGSYGELVSWLEGARAVTASQAQGFRRSAASQPDAAREVWQRAIRLREELYGVLEARAHGRDPDPASIATIQAEHLRTAALGQLRWTGGCCCLALDPSTSALDGALQPIVHAAVNLLTSARLDRLRRCGNSTCHWLFLDETRNRSRRWCEMASCGNLAKVRRHRQKARAHAH